MNVYVGCINHRGLRELSVRQTLNEESRGL
jgi:hypothetical protein